LHDLLRDALRVLLLQAFGLINERQLVPLRLGSLLDLLLFFAKL
jgi:hypothetical protein